MIPFDRFHQCFKEESSISVSAVDIFLGVATRCDVIKRSWVFDAEGSSHMRVVYQNSKTQDLTPAYRLTDSTGFTRCNIFRLRLWAKIVMSV